MNFRHEVQLLCCSHPHLSEDTRHRWNQTCAAFDWLSNWTMKSCRPPLTGTMTPDWGIICSTNAQIFMLNFNRKHIFTLHQPQNFIAHSSVHKTQTTVTPVSFTDKTPSTSTQLPAQDRRQFSPSVSGTVTVWGLHYALIKPGKRYQLPLLLMVFAVLLNF